jgi:hypothetical protein
MRILALTAVVFCIYSTCAAQEHGFEFGQVTYRELDLKVYEKDTTAEAVVLREFGEARFDNANDHNLLVEYHVKIKILKKDGLKKGTVSIPLHRQDSRVERVREVMASSFNYEHGSMHETKLDPKNIFSENISQHWDTKKFAIPNVREGTVIEYSYVLETPFVFNFFTWDFQGDIPKVDSEFWANIPANYIYNISLRGFYPLAKNESSVVKDCFAPGGGYKSDCSRFKWAMKDVPAFKEEDYMTAASNFIASIHFELSEYHYFDGRKDKITKEWKDVEEELRTSTKFGVQLRRGKDIVDEAVEALIAGETDPLIKAQKIYDFMKAWYQWDDIYGMHSELGIKKAFDSKKGNVGDINLSLVAALRYAGFNVEPLILSTRKNGSVTELHPVLGDFNYVIAKLNLNNKVYLLDATDDLHAFGLIPERCLNGKGRVLGEKESYWYDLKPTDKAKSVHLIDLVLEPGGSLKGTIQASYFGYEAVKERRKIFSFGNEKEYINNLNAKWDNVDIKNFELKNVEELHRPLVMKLEIEALEDVNAGNFIFNPFVIERWESNPFKSNERLYPVDFGAPLEEVYILTLVYPEDFELSELPEKIGLSLPNNGGRYLLDAQKNGNKLTINSSLLVAKTVFSSEEYHFLKELFNRVIAMQNMDLVFKKRH